MTQTVGRFGGRPDIHLNIEQMIERVRSWHDEYGRWFVTHTCPDGTRFPSSWPLTYEETAELVLVLAKDWDEAVAVASRQLACVIQLAQGLGGISAEVIADALAKARA